MAFLNNLTSVFFKEYIKNNVIIDRTVVSSWVLYFMPKYMFSYLKNTHTHWLKNAGTFHCQNWGVLKWSKNLCLRHE